LLMSRVVSKGIVEETSTGTAWIIITPFWFFLLITVIVKEN
jgi:hypothetical protein